MNIKATSLCGNHTINTHLYGNTYTSSVTTSTKHNIPLE